MKQRARRAVIGTGALGAVLLIALVVANWSTVRDHVQAWHFQLTRTTETLEPWCGRCGNQTETALRFFGLADMSGRPVIFALDENYDVPTWGNPPLPPYRSLALKSANDVMRVLEGEGWRVLEQRFPRRAYVVIRDAETLPDLPFFETLVIPARAVAE